MYSKEEIKAAGLDDFRVFLVQVWAHLGLPRPTPVQLDIAYWLQHGPRRGVLSAFRGVGKSWITAAYVCWLLLLNPDRKIMVVSANQALADDMSKFVKTLIRGMPILAHLVPRDGQRDSAIKFDVGTAKDSKDPSVKSVGITGQITGSRADIIIADDIEIPRNSFTHHLREQLAELIKEFDSVLKPGESSKIIFLGTPQHEESVYMKLLQRGYKMAVWCAEIPEKLDNYADRLGPLMLKLIERGAKPGDPVEPKRFPKHDLEERKASYGLSGYSLQFLLDTSRSDADRRPLKLRDLLVMSTDPEMGHAKLVWSGDRDTVIPDLPAAGLDGDRFYRPAWKSEEMAKWGGTVMAIDPSGTGKDETAYAIVRFLHGTLYLVDVGGFTDGFSEETLKALAARALEHGVNHVIVERNFGSGMFDQLLKPVLAKMGAGRIDEDWNGWSRGMKEHRILDTLEPVVRTHRLVVDRRVIEQDLKVLANTPKYSFIHQFTRMERVRGALAHDDRIEAVAMAASYWVAKMDRDRDKAVKLERDRALTEELKKFQKSVFGRKVNAQGRFRTYR